MELFATPDSLPVSLNVSIKFAFDPQTIVKTVKYFLT